MQKITTCLFLLITLAACRNHSHSDLASGEISGSGNGAVALRVSVAGKEMAPDAAFNKNVVKALTETVFAASDKGLSENFGKVVQLGFGDEGGQTFCLQPRTGSAGSVAKLFTALQEAVPEKTRYIVEGTDECDSTHVDRASIQVIVSSSKVDNAAAAFNQKVLHTLHQTLFPNDQYIQRNFLHLRNHGVNPGGQTFCLDAHKKSIENYFAKFEHLRSAAPEGVNYEVVALFEHDLTCDD